MSIVIHATPCHKYINPSKTTLRALANGMYIKCHLKKKKITFYIHSLDLLNILSTPAFFQGLYFLHRLYTLQFAILSVKSIVVKHI